MTKRHRQRGTRLPAATLAPIPILVLILVLILTAGLALPALAQEEDHSGENAARGIYPSYAEVTGAPFNGWITLGGVLSESINYDQEGLGLAFTGEDLTAGFEFLLVNDKKYTPSEQHMRGRYFDLRDGRVAWTPGNLSLTAGRLQHRDEVESPYSVFISSAAPSTTVLDLRYDNGFFFYDTRWIELNRQSSLYRREVPVLDENGDATGDYSTEPLDRGANYKAYGLDFGNLRLGIQESVVYLNSTFYPEYFLSPLPMYFTQLVNSTAGKPWTQTANENSMIGIFAEYERDRLYSYGQFLIDDWNEMGIDWLAPGEWNNPAKFAWSLGGSLETGVGTFGLHTAGASKYTFEPTYASEDDFNRYPYSYTYYPVTEYRLRDGTAKAILPEDNYIGYKYGENNIALQAEYAHGTNGFDYAATAEYTLSGSKSPANPWHELDWHQGEGTKFFDDPRLEQRLEVGSQISRSFGNFLLTGAASLGGVWNELQLEEVPGAPEESKIFKPSENDRFLWELSLELRYVFGFRRR